MATTDTAPETYSIDDLDTGVEVFVEPKSVNYREDPEAMREMLDRRIRQIEEQIAMFGRRRVGRVAFTPRYLNDTQQLAVIAYLTVPADR